jgi:transcriptional regulator with XRE-family HTH domain
VSGQDFDLRAARESTGLSREKVAALVGVTSKTIERWEKGAAVKPYRLKQLAEVYGLKNEKVAT